MVITRYKVKGPKLKAAVVADLHGEYSTELIETLKAEKPDIIACPGDLATVGEYDDRLVDPERREKRLKTQDVRYAFGYLVIISSMLFCWRSPYEAIVNAAGHFKQTKIFAFSEAGINLVVSLCLVWKYDLLGVVIGTTVAILYRNIVYNIYSAKNIVHRSPFVGIKRFLVSGATMGLIALLSMLIPMPKMVSYWNWILYAIPVTLIAIVVTVIFNFLFYKQETIVTGKKLLGIARRFVKKRA